MGKSKHKNMIKAEGGFRTRSEEEAEKELAHWNQITSRAEFMGSIHSKDFLKAQKKTERNFSIRFKKEI